MSKNKRNSSNTVIYSYGTGPTNECMFIPIMYAIGPEYNTIVYTDWYTISHYIYIIHIELSVYVKLYQTAYV